MSKLISILMIVFFTVNVAYATHNRAGEITYTHVSGLTYEILVTTYTKELSTAADRCEIPIEIAGTNSTFIDTVVRTNGNMCSDGSCSNCGLSIGSDIKWNEYRFNYTFPGPDTYTISVNDPNRNDGIMNIPNSVNTTFYIETTLVFDVFGGYNNSPQMLFPPINNACINQIYQHNPEATDIDGDSLSYELVSCLDENGDDLITWIDPSQVAGCQTPPLTIDQSTGTVTWDSPGCLGEFNICILIKEWRNGFIIGTVLRDMQITIYDCDNEPPVIDPLPKICVAAGDTIQIDIHAFDLDTFDLVELTSNGFPYDFDHDSAVFYEPFSTASDVTGQFYWETTCEHVRRFAHKIYFEAHDVSQSTFSLYAFETMDIIVVAPEPENVTASPIANSIKLDWDASFCVEAIGYKIYRKVDSLGWRPDSCETGVPSYTGYNLISTVNSLNTTTYTDDNNGEGLLHGQKYCYMIVACFADGAESYASLEVCTELVKDIPVITRVSVNSTDISNGSDTIAWSAPTAMSIVQYPGPYHYKIYKATGNQSAMTLVGTTTSEISLFDADTVWVDTLFNTQDTMYTYRIVLYSGTDLVGTTHNASSIFLRSDAQDHTLFLTWNEEVPWTNESYIIYRYNEVSAIWDTLDTVSVQTYVDDELINGETYCYFVKGIGSYSSGGFEYPLYNNSQEHCNEPFDHTPPCLPTDARIDSDCEEMFNTITWAFPADSCEDDVYTYNVYFSAELGGEMNLIATMPSPSDTTYLDNKGVAQSVAGCYKVTALDENHNESEVSTMVCADNCPIYELPRVFSPGNDGKNDIFGPFPYRYVESIDIKIFNRWGNLVHESIDPDVVWDGTNIRSNLPCVEGVYFYTCTVNEIRLIGVKPRYLKGYVHLLRPSNSTPKAN